MMIIEGFKFGILLQLAVGPMCMMVFNISTTYGFIYGLYLVLSIALVDALYIGLSCVGAASIIDKGKIETLIKLIGCFVLILFGANTILGAFNLSILPKTILFKVSMQNIFYQGLVLTASNPLTIIFWSGIFTTQIIKKGWNKKQLFLFAIGCVMSTLVFLTIVAFLGSILRNFLPIMVIQILNGFVGTTLIFFGVKLLLKKENSKSI